MTRRHSSKFGGIGRLTYQPASDDGLVQKTFEFIRLQLPAWRDDPSRPDDQTEKPLNSSLCDFLDLKSRSENGLPMARFKHEAPQAGQSTVDIGVHGASDETLIGIHRYSKYRPFLVIEAKRLPPPRKERQKEYVTGSNSSGNPSGGIQRLKLGLHGKEVEDAAMIGYIQTETSQHWHRQINGWIAELAGVESHDGCIWSNSDQLNKLTSYKTLNLTTCDSSHQRLPDCLTGNINIRHLWVRMR